VSKAGGAESLTWFPPMTSPGGMVATGGRVLDERNGFEPPELEKLGCEGPVTNFVAGSSRMAFTFVLNLMSVEML